MQNKKRCVLHRHIRNHSWPLVICSMRNDPTQIVKRNGVGWSSLVLALYHLAPTEIISEMLTSVQTLVGGDGERDVVDLLSIPVPNGCRLCLHFAARYSDSIETIQILTEAYPQALLARSTDGATPLDRAIYYRKSGPIIHYLERATKKESHRVKLLSYNEELRNVVLDCCKRKWNESNKNTLSKTERESSSSNHDNDNNNGSNNNTFGNSHGDDDDDPHDDEATNNGSITSSESCSSSISSNKEIEFVASLYGYCAERELIGLFRNILSCVGVYDIPSSS